MAKFTKKSNNIVLLKSDGTTKDSLLVAKWARTLMEKADAKVTNKDQLMPLSSSHRTDYAPSEVTLSFKDYYYSDISFWLKLCKK
jgi:hypothetical protein